jgi:pimeloyl-ACP methyl ester carboxylesterase
MPYCAVRGVDHYYEWISESEPLTGAKPVMVFIHGWAGSARYWQSTAQALQSHYDCLLYDMRGFGRSPLPKPIPPDVAAIGYELDSYADDLAMLLDQLGIERISINAHSTGASVAALFLNRYGDRVDQAILTCNGIFEYDEKAFTAFHQFGKYVVSFRPRWLASIPFLNRIFMARFLHRSLPDTYSRAFLEDFLMADYDAALGTIYTAVSKKAVEIMPQEFAQVQVPTLLVSGEYDQIIPAEMGRRAVALNPRMEHVVIANTSHFPMLEDPDTYLEQIQQFLGIAHSEVATLPLS